MEKMEGKTESLETVNNNNALLLAQLNNVINKLQIPYNYQVVPLEAYFAGGMEAYHPPLPGSVISMGFRRFWGPNGW